MTSSDITEGEPDIYLREQEEYEDEDPWDDSVLVQAYTKAVSKAKQNVLRKVQKELNLTNEEVEGIISEDNTSVAKNQKDKKKKNKRVFDGNMSRKWKVGDACRAVYSEDGEEYEAEIVKICDSQETCLVRFLGYENEGEVLLSDITSSLGKKAIKMQMQMAEMEREFEEGMYFDNHTSSLESAPKKAKEPKLMFRADERYLYNQPADYQQQTAPPHFAHMGPPPPIPPMPPNMGVFNSFASPAGLPATDSGQLDSMLLSWFMCGYYTGYYKRDTELQIPRM